MTDRPTTVGYFCVACEEDHNGSPAAVVNGNPVCGDVFRRLNARGILRAADEPEPEVPAEAWARAFAEMARVLRECFPQARRAKE